VPIHTELRRLRYAKGYSQEELSTILDISAAALYKYETGRVKRPRPGIARRLVDFFGVPLSTLLRPEMETPPAPRGAEGELNDVDCKALVPGSDLL
jgi:transcriptional regulator with XRE-family HTH domain